MGEGKRTSGCFDHKTDHRRSVYTPKPSGKRMSHPKGGTAVVKKTSSFRSKPSNLWVKNKSNKYIKISDVTRDLRRPGIMPTIFDNRKAKHVTSIIKMRPEHNALIKEIGVGIIKTGDENDMKLRFCYHNGVSVFVLSSDVKFGKNGKWTIKLKDKHGWKYSFSGGIEYQGRVPIFEYSSNGGSKLSFTKSFMPYIPFDTIIDRLNDEIVGKEEIKKEVMDIPIYIRNVSKTDRDTLDTILNAFVDNVFKTPKRAMIFRYSLVGTSKREDPNDIYRRLNDYLNLIGELHDDDDDYAVNIDYPDKWIVFEVIKTPTKTVIKVCQFLHTDITRNGKESAGFNLATDRDIKYFTDLKSRLLIEKMFGIKPYFKSVVTNTKKKRK